MNTMYGNVFTELPDASTAEIFQNIATLADGRTRVERIVSEGQASPEGWWYDQEWDEWVLILRGGAVVEVADPPSVRRLVAGDWLFLPARLRHRVARTEAGTLWLAVHAGWTGHEAGTGGMDAGGEG